MRIDFLAHWSAQRLLELSRASATRRVGSGHELAGPVINRMHMEFGPNVGAYRGQRSALRLVAVTTDHDREDRAKPSGFDLGLP